MQQFSGLPRQNPTFVAQFYFAWLCNSINLAVQIKPILMASNQISSENISGLAFSTTLNGHTIVTDSAAEGQDLGPGPKRLMLVALTGCTGIDVVSILKKMKVAYSDLKIDVDAALTDEDAAIYHTVKLTYYIKVAEADQSKVEKAVALSMDKYCGVSAMFQKFANLSREIVFL
jgi:putative redox protein